MAPPRQQCSTVGGGTAAEHCWRWHSSQHRAWTPRIQLYNCKGASDGTQLPEALPVVRPSGHTTRPCPSSSWSSSFRWFEKATMGCTYSVAAPQPSRRRAILALTGTPRARSRSPQLPLTCVRSASRSCSTGSTFASLLRSAPLWPKAVVSAASRRCSGHPHRPSATQWQLGLHERAHGQRTPARQHAFIPRAHARRRSARRRPRSRPRCTRRTSGRGGAPCHLVCHHVCVRRRRARRRRAR